MAEQWHRAQAMLRNVARGLVRQAGRAYLRVCVGGTGGAGRASWVGGHRNQAQVCEAV